MSREEALRLLSLADSSSRPQIESALAERLAAARGRLESAPNEALRAKYQSAVSEVEAAGRALLAPRETSVPPSLSMTMAADLPAATPSYTVGDAQDGEAAGARLSLSQGQVLAGRYEIRERIGAGGMGAVFRAFDRNRQSEIAIKVMLPSLIGRGKAKERFLAEAKLSSALSHPGIVNVFDVQNEGELFFLTMELLEGRTLREEMAERAQRREPFPIERAVSIAKSVCEALEYAHKTTVHRDVKPENVFVCADGSVKLMDFGIARVLSTSQLTMTGAAMGTAYYMAPEQLRGASEVDGRADQYSVGVMLYEMLTRQVPVGRALPVSQIRKRVTRRLSEAIDQALAAEPEQRFESASDLARAIGKGGDNGSGASKVLMPKWTKFAMAIVLLAIAVFGARVPISQALARASYDATSVAEAESKYNELLQQWETLQKDHPQALTNLVLPAGSVEQARDASADFDARAAALAWGQAQERLDTLLATAKAEVKRLEDAEKIANAAQQAESRRQADANADAVEEARASIAKARTSKKNWDDRLGRIQNWSRELEGEIRASSRDERDERLKPSELIELDQARRELNVYEDMIYPVVDQKFSVSIEANNARSELDAAESVLNGRDPASIDGAALKASLNLVIELFDRQERELRHVPDVVKHMASAERAIEGVEALLPRESAARRLLGLDTRDLLSSSRGSYADAVENVKEGRLEEASKLANEAATDGDRLQSVAQSLSVAAASWSAVLASSANCGCDPLTDSGAPVLVQLVDDVLAGHPADLERIEGELRDWIDDANRLVKLLKPLEDFVNSAANLSGSILFARDHARRVCQNNVPRFAIGTEVERQQCMLEVGTAIDVLTDLIRK